VQVLLRLEVIPLNANGGILWEQVAQMSGGRLQWQSAADGLMYANRLSQARRRGSAEVKEKVAEIDKKIALQREAGQVAEGVLHVVIKVRMRKTFDVERSSTF
jgi:hypothetical protein